MYASYSQGNKCVDCGINFESPNQLLNHKRRFCINSGYDNLEGLAKIEFNGVKLSHQPKIGHKNYLQQYGANSLTKVGEQALLTASNLEKDMKNVNRYKRQLDGMQKYNHKQDYDESQLSNSKSSILNQTRRSNNYDLNESRLDEQLKRYQKAPNEAAISPPTYIDKLNMRNHTILDKSNSSLGRMKPNDKLEYALVKLGELNEIKDSYIKNGGKKPEFKANIDKMIVFYEKLLQQCRNKSNGEGQMLNNSQSIIQSRVSTPILKLRELNEEEMSSRKKNRTREGPLKTSQTKDQRLKNSNNKQNNNQMYPLNNPYQYAQPQIIMMPQQTQNVANDGFKLLEKMIELKSEENQRLLQILLEEKRRNNQPQQSYMPFPQYGYPQQSLPLNSNIQPNSNPTDFKQNPKQKYKHIDVTDNYQFKKSMIEDLISEQKVLLAMQQQQLDEMKLLSQLPNDLQQIKLNSVIKASETRFNVQKQILKQKLDRLAYQQQNQTFEQSRKMNNDKWAGQERKKLLQNQMNRYISNFQQEFQEQEQQNQ